MRYGVQKRVGIAHGMACTRTLPRRARMDRSTAAGSAPGSNAGLKHCAGADSRPCAHCASGMDGSLRKTAYHDARAHARGTATGCRTTMHACCSGFWESGSEEERVPLWCETVPARPSSGLTGWEARSGARRSSRTSDPSARSTRPHCEMCRSALRGTAFHLWCQGRAPLPRACA